MPTASIPHSSCAGERPQRREPAHPSREAEFNSPRAPRRVAWARLRSPRIAGPLAAVSPRRGRLGLWWALPRLALRRRSGTPRRDAADRADDVGTVLNEARLVGRRVRRRDRQWPDGAERDPMRGCASQPPGLGARVSGQPISPSGASTQATALLSSRARRSTKWCDADPGSRSCSVARLRDPGPAVHR